MNERAILLPRKLGIFTIYKKLAQERAQYTRTWRKRASKFCKHLAEELGSAREEMRAAVSARETTSAASGLRVSQLPLDAMVREIIHFEGFQ